MGFLILGLIGIFLNNLVAGEPLAIALVLIIAIFSFVLMWILIKKYFMNTPPPSVTIKVIDKMTGLEFEQFIGDLYKQMGNKSEVTQASNDYDADVIVIKDHIKTVMHVKNYKNSEN
jgi:restriction system protein